MYEIISVTNTTNLHDTFESYEKEWFEDHPKFLDFVEEKMSSFYSSSRKLLRRDMEWSAETNSCTITLLFDNLPAALDYIRETWLEAFHLDVSKTKYNDVQFREFMLNTTVSLLEGKYTIKIVSLKEIN